MHHAKALTASSGTTRGDPDTLTFKVVPQIVTKVRIYFPPGCAGLVRVALFNGDHQFAPSDPGNWFRGDGGSIEYEEYYDMRKGPNKITIKAWNEDSVYDHEVLVGITILPEWIASPLKSLAKLGKALASMMGLEEV